MKTWQRVFLVLVALATASGGYLFTSRRLASGQEALPASTQLVEVRRGNLTVRVTTVGSVVLPRQARLSFGVAGTIATILVQEGDRVTAGQTLARLDDIPSFQSAVAQTQANLKQAQKNLEDARKQSPTAVPQAEQAVSNARLAIQTAQEALADAKVLDPVLLAQKEQAVANARVSLQTAQEALADAQVLDPVLLTQKEQTVANARMALQAAQEALSDAQQPFAAQDLADAKAAVVSAQRSWDLAKQDVSLTRQTWDTKVRQAEDAYSTALEAYREKVKAYWGVDLTESQASQDPSTITPNPDILSLWNTFLPFLNQDAVNTTIRTAWQAFVTARDNRDSQRSQRDKAIVAAEQAERQAGANLRKAQEPLDNMVVDLLQVALKQAQVATAQANLQKAIDDLAEFKKGPDPLAVALKQAQVVTAQANLQKAIDDLAEFKKGPDPLNVALKQAQVATAQANLQKTQEDLETARAGPDPVLVELREAQVASAQEAVTTAQKNLASASMTAPFAGIINSISLKVGERIGTNTVVMEIVDYSQAEVRATLDEVDLSRVKPGQRTAITMDALPDTRINGQVAFVALVGTRQAGVVTYPLKVTMTLPSGVVLRDGVTATLNVVVEEKRGVLLVPSRALKRQGRNWLAQVMVSGKPEDRQVTVGASSDQQIEVLYGLNEGDKVMVTTTTGTRTAPGQVPGGLGGGGMMPGGVFR